MNKKINTLIVDDEIGAIRTLSGMLNTYYPQINILDNAQTVNDGVDKVKKLQPQLVFLDVEMPPFGSGFDFLEKCKDFSFGVIFTTAYPNYAIKAINDIQPWGYLVKPYSVDHLGAAIETAEEKIRQNEKAKNDPHYTPTLIVSDFRKGKIVVLINSILYCKADGSSTHIYYLKNDKIVSLITSSTLKSMEPLLPIESFYRCHHSYIVNLNFIDKVKSSGRNGVIYLHYGIEVPISISKKDAFVIQFSKFHDKK